VLTDFAACKGIALELTAGYSPESNGAAERLNRTLIERARAMLLDASLPLDFGVKVLSRHVMFKIGHPSLGLGRGLFFVFFTRCVSSACIWLQSVLSCAYVHDKGVAW
jgi:hypothetical protein